MIADPLRTIPTVDDIRTQFPALQSGFAYLDNAGGAQVPASVADAVREYMLTTYVQLGASYDQSIRATQTVEEAHAFSNLVMGGVGTGKTILGSSTTALCHVLANSYALSLEPGSRIVAAETGHEANIGPWANLAKRGFDFQLWRFDPNSLQCPLETLEDLLRPGNTKIVAFPHVSNVLGDVVDVKPIVDLARRYGARVVVDGVAYAPHRIIDVAAWGADWYVFSWYKVFAPHMAALYGSNEALAEVEGPNHFFIPRDSIPYKFELGGAVHECCAGLLGLRPYLNFLTGQPEDATMTRETVVEAFRIMEEIELPLQGRFVDYLKSKPEFRIVGPAHGERSRVATISFTHERFAPAEVAQKVHRHPLGIRNGNAYAYRLCQALGINPTTGVARASFAHYTTMEEVERLITALDELS